MDLLKILRSPFFLAMIYLILPLCGYFENSSHPPQFFTQGLFASVAFFSAIIPFIFYTVIRVSSGDKYRLIMDIYLLGAVFSSLVISFHSAFSIEIIQLETGLYIFFAAQLFMVICFVYYCVMQLQKKKKNKKQYE